MNDLETYFTRNNKRQTEKWMHYFDIYDRHFGRFRNKDVVVLEIGVAHGGSLQMWKHYFGDKAKIYGVDRNPDCKGLEEDDVQILIGSQSDRNFLKTVRGQIPPVDILIDDGGHTMVQQIATFEELFGCVKETGVYLCEDLHTSYWLSHGGGHKRRGTFIEYSKNFVDHLNAHHSEQRSLNVNSFTASVDSLHYYDSVLVIEKRKRERRHQERTGTATLTAPDDDTKIRQQARQAKHFILRLTNNTLRFFRLKGFIWR